MWRTGVTLLLVSLALASATETIDQIANVAVHQDKGPAQERLVKQNSESLVADVPQEPKPEEPKKEEGNTFSRALRVMRQDVFPGAMKAVGLGGIFATQKEFQLATSDNRVTLTYGQTNKIAIATQLSLANDVIFVYGNPKCTGIKCRKTEVKNTFDVTKSNQPLPTSTFKYQPTSGEVEGVNYKDQIVLVGDLKIDNYVFGVATMGLNNVDIVTPPAEGYIGLGFEKPAGVTTAYNNAKNLFNAVPDNKVFTIWQADDLKSGIINFGNDTYEKCPPKKSALQTATKDKAGNQQWWFKADKVEVDGKSTANAIIRVTFDEDTIGLPKDQVDQINGKLDKNSVISDAKNLPPIKITIGKEEIQIKGEGYATGSDKKFKPSISTVADQEYHVSLGRKFFTKSCVAFKQNGDNYQIGIIYTESFSSSMTVSVFGLIMLPLVYFIGL